MVNQNFRVHIALLILFLSGCAVYDEQIQSDRHRASCPWRLTYTGFFNARCLPPVSLTTRVRSGMTLPEVEAILGPASSRVSGSLLVWDTFDQNSSWIREFFIGFDREGKADYLNSGGGSGNPVIDVNIYRR